MNNYMTDERSLAINPPELTDLELEQLSANAQLLLGVDEFTLVLKSENDNPGTWVESCETLMDELLELSKLVELFGEFEKSKGEVKGVNGYTEVYAPNRPWYLTVNFNPERIDMGICLRFSAQSWAAYRQDYKKLYGTSIQIMDFLRMIQSPNYTVRLSRIDLDADYLNNEYFDGFAETIFPATIDDYLNRGIYLVYNAKDQRRTKHTEGRAKDGTVETLYIGSPKSGDVFLRIYNKKLEQLESRGQYYDTAKSCDTWIRMEAVFRGEPAHLLTEQLTKDVHTTEELHRFIAKHITDRYRFYELAYGHYTEFTQDLLDIADGAAFAAALEPSRQDRELHKSIRVLIERSGLMSILYKIEQLFGTTAEKEFYDYLTGYYDYKYRPFVEDKNRALAAWPKKYKPEYANIEFRDVLQEVGLVDKSYWEDDSLFTDESDLLHTDDVARLLRISEKEVIEMANFGILVSRRHKGKKIFLKQDVIDYVRKLPLEYIEGALEDEPEF